MFACFGGWLRHKDPVSHSQITIASYRRLATQALGILWELLILQLSPHPAKSMAGTTRMRNASRENWPGLCLVASYRRLATEALGILWELLILQLSPHPAKSMAGTTRMRNASRKNSPGLCLFWMRKFHTKSGYLPHELANKKINLGPGVCRPFDRCLLRLTRHHMDYSLSLSETNWWSLNSLRHFALQHQLVRWGRLPSFFGAHIIRFCYIGRASLCWILAHVRAANGGATGLPHTTICTFTHESPDVASIGASNHLTQRYCLIKHPLPLSQLSCSWIKASRF
jgi:hypothetical protein